MGSKDLELNPSVDRLEAGGEMQLRVTNLQENKAEIMFCTKLFAQYHS